MYIINKSLDIAVKKNGKATYADFWRLDPYKQDFLAWKNGEDIYIETTFCDLEKICKYVRRFENMEG